MCVCVCGGGGGGDSLIQTALIKSSHLINIFLLLFFSLFLCFSFTLF